MLPMSEIKAWRKNADWPLDEQVEQDLILSAALVCIFNNDFLKGKLAFRGGTALNMLIFPKALRYSEDIDMNRLQSGAVGPILDAIRKSLKDLFPKKAKSEQTDNSVKLIYTYPSITGADKNLKIEINVRETLPQEELEEFPFSIESGYFTGETTILAFDREEMIGTKIRALYQRRKGRDLFDLFELSKLDLNWDKIVESYKKLNIGATRLDFEKNLVEKMLQSDFLEDINPLLPTDVTYDPEVAYAWFKEKIIPRM